jgi:hypothetical protein
MKRILALIILTTITSACSPKQPKLGAILGNPKDVQISKPSTKCKLIRGKFGLREQCQK